MPSPAPYFELIREMRDAYNHRLRLVAHARQHGIQAAAREYRAAIPTVRQWLRRYQQHGLGGLQERSRAPHSCPHQTPPQIERQVVELRRQLPTFGAARLKREFDLSPSHKAIQRIWRAHGLIQKRRRKYQRKQDLAAVKATWRLFQQISADTIVLAAGAKPFNPLQEVLEKKRIPFKVVGDAMGVATAFNAVHQGFAAGREL